MTELMVCTANKMSPSCPFPGWPAPCTSVVQLPYGGCDGNVGIRPHVLLGCRPAEELYQAHRPEYFRGMLQSREMKPVFLLFVGCDTVEFFSNSFGASLHFLPWCGETGTGSGWCNRCRTSKITESGTVPCPGRIVDAINEDEREQTTPPGCGAGIA